MNSLNTVLDDAYITLLETRSAALASLPESICGKGFEVKAGFEEATRQAISTWNDVADAARYYDNEDEYP